MAKTIKKIAKQLGATIVSQVPETGGGAFGACATRTHRQPIAAPIAAERRQTARATDRPLLGSFA